MKKSIYSKKQAALARCLIEARQKADLTQQALADRLGKPQSFVAKYETGERRLDVVEFLEIAKLLGADPHAIIKEIA